MKALVTGANGFIGAHLCRKLLQEQVEVYAMVRRTSNLTLLQTIVPEYDQIHVIYGDITDYDSLLTHVVDKEIIFNLAGVLKGLTQEEYDRVNVDGYNNVCKAVIEKNCTIKRVVMTSSVAAAGPSCENQPSDEKTPLSPLAGDRYGISKVRMEKAIQEYQDRIPLVVVRPPTVLGPGDTPSLDLFKLTKRGWKTVIGKGVGEFSVVSVEDLVDGYYLCATHPKAVGEVFYFCTGSPLDWGDLQELIACEAFGRQKSLHTLHLSPKMAIRVGGIMEFFGKIVKKTPFLNKPKMIEGACKYWAFSCEKAKKMLGWQPKETIESTVKKAAKWYADHGWL
jgi:nucleoside-diphosphate-sugar epimerase